MKTAQTTKPDGLLFFEVIGNIINETPSGIAILQIDGLIEDKCVTAEEAETWRKGDVACIVTHDEGTGDPLIYLNPDNAADPIYTPLVDKMRAALVRRHYINRIK